MHDFITGISKDILGFKPASKISVKALEDDGRLLYFGRGGQLGSNAIYSHYLDRYVLCRTRPKTARCQVEMVKTNSAPTTSRPKR